MGFHAARRGMVRGNADNRGIHIHFGQKISEEKFINRLDIGLFILKPSVMRRFIRTLDMDIEAVVFLNIFNG
jgi:hypothetical protein